MPHHGLERWRSTPHFQTVTNWFIEREAGAANEAEAAKLFEEFIISESQIRRERYNKAWESDAFDVEDVRRRLFEPQNTTESEFASSRRSSREINMTDIPQTRPESGWWKDVCPHY